jgi:hypothetical protein
MHYTSAAWCHWSQYSPYEVGNLRKPAHQGSFKFFEMSPANARKDGYYSSNRTANHVYEPTDGWVHSVHEGQPLLNFFPPISNSTLGHLWEGRGKQAMRLLNVLVIHCATCPKKRHRPDKVVINSSFGYHWCCSFHSWEINPLQAIRQFFHRLRQSWSSRPGTPCFRDGVTNADTICLFGLCGPLGSIFFCC